MSNYIPTIGLEVHAQLRTATKMFCNSKNDPDETTPNVNVCPVCMGHPGTLPTLNKEAIKHVLMVGTAVGGTLADFTEWDRKNYFYPDIPKGYQISQYKYPLVSGGSIGGTAITRIHLEEDTGLNKHEGDYSLVDYNRAGIPLMELVTEPVIHSGDEAMTFAKEFQLLLRYLGASDANMEKGEMRVEANVSISKDGELGTKTEVKNLNSFRSVGRAIEYEIKRQEALLEAGEKVVQETRGWDENKQETFSQRKKESSEDYRYFPEPDLPKLKISELPELIPKLIQELPWERRKRYEDLGLKKEDADMFVTRTVLGDFLDDAIKKTEDEKIITTLANQLVSDIAGMGEDVDDIGQLTTSTAIAISSAFVAGDISSRGAKDAFKEMYEKGGDVEAIIASKKQTSDEEELKKIAEKIISENSQAVEEYKAGKEASLQFLVGQVMKETQGSANPTVLQKLFKELLNG